MSVRLYVGNLPYRMTETELNDLFGAAGQVTDVVLPIDSSSGRPRGFGFVEMADDAGAQAAIEQFNGYSLEGRELVVNIARPREDSGGGRRVDGGPRRW